MPHSINLNDSGFFGDNMAFLINTMINTMGVNTFSQIAMATAGTFSLASASPMVIVAHGYFLLTDFAECHFSHFLSLYQTS
jgi:hypothetical protein